ncbi:MAG: hypothetical protein RQ936_10120 [Gammaproteobacteria bacterium]|nr:hypothetical protein [Gammaproteobacteria bacterium]
MSNFKKSVSIAIGATFIASMAAVPLSNADENPFGMQKLNAGYLQVAAVEGKCGEGKSDENGKSNDKAKEKDKEGKCGEGDKSSEKEKEGKCGEAKCGASN